MNLLNSRQLASLWGGILVIAIMGIVPPWREGSGAGNPLPYAPIFNPPSLAAASGVTVDYSRLSVQWLITLVITGGLLASFQKANAQSVSATGQTASSGQSAPTAQSAPIGSSGGATASAGAQAQKSASAKPERSDRGTDNVSKNGSKEILKQVRTLSFPAESLGDLLVESEDDEEYWEFFAQAAGQVSVPFGRHVQLELASDAGGNISHLSTLPSDAFYSIDFSGSRLSDEDLSHVRHFTELRELDLSDTSVTDLGIKSLAGLSKLKKVWLDNTRVTDKGLEELANHREMEKVSIIGTQIDAPAAQSLLKVFPGKCALVLEENV
jgi:hypothetical protein